MCVHNFCLVQLCTKLLIMSATIITLEDLITFKEEFFAEFKKLLNENPLSKTDHFIKTPELRRLLKISHGTLQHLRINGTIPYTKVGGIIYYDKREIEKMITENKINNSFKL